MAPNFNHFNGIVFSVFKPTVGNSQMTIKIGCVSKWGALDHKSDGWHKNMMEGTVLMFGGFSK